MLLPLLLITSCFSADERILPSAPMFQQEVGTPTAAEHIQPSAPSVDMLEQEVDDPTAHAHAPPPTLIENEYDLPCCIKYSCFCNYSRTTQFSLRSSAREENRLLNAAMQAMRAHEGGPGVDSCALCSSRDNLQEHYCRAQTTPAGRPESDHPKICDECKNNHCCCPFCFGPKFRKMLVSPAQQTMSGAEGAQPLLQEEDEEELPCCAKYCCKPTAEIFWCVGKCLGICTVEIVNGVGRAGEWVPFCFWNPCNGCLLMLGDCGACISKTCGRCGRCIGRECRGCSIVWNNARTDCCRAVYRRMRRRCCNDAREIEDTHAEDPSANPDA